MNVQEARDPWDLKKFWFSKETLSKAEIENNDVKSCQIMNRAKKIFFIKMTVNNNKLQYSLLNAEKPLPTMLKIQIRSLNDPFPSCVEYIR